jgi:hypothetical protein
VPKKKVAVKYTSRDFISIKRDLVEYAKRYYPETYRDFNEASFGSLMLDTVAYVGDMLSFYLDYQSNESFLSTAIEYDNVVKLSKQLGYRPRFNPSSFGVATFYLMIPAAAVGTEPDTTYLPTLEKGSEFVTESGQGFILNEDIRFAEITRDEFAAGLVDPQLNTPTHYVVKSTGRVISGALRNASITVGVFEKFKKVRVPGQNIAEILSVVDSDGNDYYEVEYLSQDVIYKPIKNRKTGATEPSAVMTAVPVPRRFIVDQDTQGAYLQFGFGSDSQLVTKSVADPSQIVLEVYGKDYFADKTIDPNNLLATDKFGVGPSDTILTITYRANTVNNMNVAPGGLNTVASPILKFDNVLSLSTNKVTSVINSLEVNNDDSIVGSITYPSSEELRQRAISTFATQNRAVTKQDYISMVYNMPPEYGSIKRCNIVQDKDSFKRNLNIYVVSESDTGTLTESNITIKENLKTWLNNVKMINDTIDILDARIVNLGIEFVAIADTDVNQYELLNDVYSALTNFFEIKPNLSQPFYISDMYNVINDVPGIVDVVTVDVARRSTAGYSQVNFNIADYITPDGRMIVFPEDFIWEIKNLKADIKGTLK